MGDRLIYRRNLLLLLVGCSAVSIPTGAAQLLVCPDFGMIPYSREKIEAALAEVPGLRKYVLDFMEDPLIPRQTKMIIRHALEKNDTEVRKLTSELRAAWRISKKMTAVAQAKKANYVIWEKPHLPQTFTQELNGKIRARFNSKFGIAVQDRKVVQAHNDVLVLIHELGHIRFETYLRKNLSRLKDRFPPSLIFQKGDKIHINNQLSDLLHERYVYEKEKELEKYGFGKYFEWRGGIPGALGRKPSEVAALVGKHVVDEYELSDPIIRLLADEPTDVLLSGARAKFADIGQVEHVLPEVRRFKDPDQTELAYRLSMLALEAEGETRSEVHVGLIEEAFYRVGEQSGGEGDRLLLNAVGTVLHGFEGRPKAQLRVLRFLVAPENVRQTEALLGTRLLPDQAFTIEDFTRLVEKRSE